MSAARRFLEMLGAQLPGRASAARSMALRQYATMLAADMPEHTLTADVARDVAERLNDMPTYQQVLAAVRSSPAIPARPFIPMPNAPQPVDEEAMDHEWWLARFARWRDDPPEIELANLNGAMLALTGRDAMQRGKCHPRPRIVSAAQNRIAELESAGIEPADLRRVKSRRLNVVAPGPHGPTVATRPVAPPAATAKPIADAVLLAHYERLAQSGDRAAVTRAEQIRSRLTQPETQEVSA